MSSREGYPEARPPGSHFCLSLARGDVIRSVRLGRAGVGALAALALIAFAWTASVTAYVAFHDDLMGAILARQAEMKAAYEDRLAEARARLDEAASRQLLERNAFNDKVNELVSRQARLEQRGAIVAALAGTEARNHARGCSAPSRNRKPRRRAQRDPGSRSVDGAPRERGRRRARLRASSWPRRRASGRQASSDR